MLLICKDCGNRYLTRDVATLEAWCAGLGWAGPEGPCPRCTGDPVNKAPWSWSQLESFETCPKRHHALKVARTHVEPPSLALIEGRQTHDALNKAIRLGEGLPEDLQWLFPFVAGLRQQEARSERSLAFTVDWRGTGKWAEDVWLRIVLDVEVRKPGRSLVVDWKTGRRKPGQDQLTLQATALLLSDETLHEVQALFVWLDARTFDRIAVDVTKAVVFIADIRARLSHLQAAMRTGIWPATPCWACHFCPLIDCAHNKSRNR